MEDEVGVPGPGSTEQDSASNPYDFRNPVRMTDRLIGRERELERIGRCMDSTRQGQPIHMALIGERAAGKTSLLNVSQNLAREKGLLVVKLDLDETVVTNPVYFFDALFQSAMGALMSAGALAEDDPRLSAWTRQVLMGLEVPLKDQALLFGNIAVGKMQGASPDDVSPFVLKHDFDKIAELACDSGLKGVLIVLDEGDLLGTKSAIFQKLRNVLQDSTNWMLITAGTRFMFSTMSEVFSPIPRQFERISVEGLSDRLAVRSCMRKPLPVGSKVTIPMSVVDDVMATTHGRPYEINLVSYFIWEEVARSKEPPPLRFILTQRVLDNVLEELRDLSLESSVKEVDRIRALGPPDFEDLADTVPFTRMTVRQAALIRLLPRDFEPEELAATERIISRQLENLISLSVMQRDGDRFHVVGDQFVQVYLKFDLARHGRDHKHSSGYGGLTYAQAVADAFAPSALTANGAITNTHTLMKRQIELGHSRKQSIGERFCQDVRDRDVVAVIHFSSLFGFFLRSPASEEDGIPRLNLSAHHVAVGLSFQVGVEVIDIVVLVEADLVDALAVELQLRSWKDEYDGVLQKFDATLQEIVTADVSTEFLSILRDYSEAQQGRYLPDMFSAFDAGDYKKACATVQNAVAVLNSYLDPHIGTSRFRSDQEALAEATNRQGFLTLLLGGAIEAKTLFERAMSIDDHEKDLRLFNAARCQFELEEWFDAEQLFDSAQFLWSSRSEGAFLMAAIALPEPIKESLALVTHVEPEWGERFCSAHSLLSQIRSGSKSAADMDQWVRDSFEDPGVPPVIWRILAWERFRTGAHREALEVLLHANDLYRDDIQLIAEVSYLESLLGRQK